MSASDPYLQPNGVLRDKLGIQDGCSGKLKLDTEGGINQTSFVVFCTQDNKRWTI